MADRIEGIWQLPQRGLILCEVESAMLSLESSEVFRILLRCVKKQRVVERGRRIAESFRNCPRLLAPLSIPRITPTPPQFARLFVETTARNNLGRLPFALFPEDQFMQRGHTLTHSHDDNCST